MRTALIIIGLLVAIYVAGWFKTTQVETSIEIAATPDQVWEVLTNFDAYPEWNPFIKEISGTPEVGETLSVRVEPLHADATPMTFTPKVLVADASREFRWIGRLIIPGIMDGEHYFVLEATADGTRLIHGEKFRGILDYFIDMSVMNQSFNAMNEALKARAEE
jgi:hypothetical protein